MIFFLSPIDFPAPKTANSFCLFLGRKEGCQDGRKEGCGAWVWVLWLVVSVIVMYLSYSRTINAFAAALKTPDAKTAASKRQSIDDFYSFLNTFDQKTEYDTLELLLE